MNQLDAARSIEAPDSIRTRALLELRRQTQQWGLALPDTEPLVLDFGLGDFDRIGLTEVWVANEVSAGYCGKYLFVTDGQTCPLHHHRSKHETFFVVQGKVRVMLDGRAIDLGEGGVLPVPAPLPHSFTGIGPALLLELSQPCIIADNYFDDPRIPIGGNHRIDTK